MAEDEADAGSPARALEWLDAAEALSGGLLPPKYQQWRRRWTLVP
jgi:hypothetical protein